MLKVFTAFSGMDAQCMALDRIGTDYDLVGWSEIDKNAIKAHNALFPQYKDRNYGDISAIDWSKVPDIDLFTYSSPCQDFSKAGKKQGGEEGSGTRSSLLWECKRAIEAKRPRFLILENVKNLVSDAFLPLFNRWEQYLASLGYTNYYKVLNAKDYGVPQNRERVFLVSILDEDRYFQFPDPDGCPVSASELLDSIIEEKHFLSEKAINKLTKNGAKFIRREDFKVARTICSSMDKHTTFDNYIVDDVLLVPEATIKGYAEVRPKTIFLSNYMGSKTRRGRVQEDGRLCPTITTESGLCVYEGGERVRRLTERECFRFMGVNNENIDTLMHSGIKTTYLYRIAGNSIVVDVLASIFRNLIHGCELPDGQLF